LNAKGNSKDLTKWVSLLARFNGGVPLGKELIEDIEHFFDYYWEFNRLGALETDLDLNFRDQLPLYVQNEIYMNYLFVDFCYKYKTYFKPKLVDLDNMQDKL